MSQAAERFAQALRLSALGSGLVLFAVALVELGTDAVGVVSLEAMGRIADWRDALLHSAAGLAILALALACHIGATLALTARRATMRMSWSDAAEILSGIL
ncbi:MAG: adenylate/guanylate cyclase domain-containing protein, partial [Bradyrhizobium sp.]|nr:adenylate/guanylate cyclase domain-containing protein [Bradyrhizobium sp.]